MKLVVEIRVESQVPTLDESEFRALPDADKEVVIERFRQYISEQLADFAPKDPKIIRIYTEMEELKWLN